MSKNYPTDPVERFLQVAAHHYLSPALKMKTLTGIAYNMNFEQIEKARQELKRSYQERLERLREMGAPLVLRAVQRRLLDPKKNHILRILDLADTHRAKRMEIV